jgi:hypothetical protein
MRKYRCSENYPLLHPELLNTGFQVFRVSRVVRSVLMIPETRPTVPSSNLTLIPWGWKEEPVRISRTIPRVFFPFRWSSFLITSTVIPALIEDLSFPSFIRAPVNSRLWDFFVCQVHPSYYIGVDGKKTDEPGPLQERKPMVPDDLFKVKNEALPPDRPEIPGPSHKDHPVFGTQTINGMRDLTFRLYSTKDSPNSSSRNSSSLRIFMTRAARTSMVTANAQNSPMTTVDPIQATRIPV